MNVLIGLTDSKEYLFVQAYLLLRNKGIYIDEVDYIHSLPVSEEKQFISFWQKEKIIVTKQFDPDISTIEDEDDYATLEERVMVWYANLYSKNHKLYVFAGGGHKLFSFALTKCTQLFGAEEVFHVFFRNNIKAKPNTIEGITDYILKGQLIMASLGKEIGWPALSKIPLGPGFKKNIDIITRSISQRSIEQINEYPFECINLLPPKVLSWLEGPLCETDEQWVKLLPKTELHCHLGGFATSGTCLEQVRRAAIGEIPPLKKIEVPGTWPFPHNNIPLDQYMALGDNNGSTLLQDPGCLEKHIRLLYQHFLEQNIKYAEVRCSPGNYSRDDRHGDQVLDDIIYYFNDEMEKAIIAGSVFCQVNLVIIATRKDNRGDDKLLKYHIELATRKASVSRESGQCHVVGLDLAGYESEDTRGIYFRTSFEPAHRAGVCLTIHAGENDAEEGIWQAVLDLNTRRIGHGLKIVEDDALVRTVIDHRIGVEMCPFANFQIVGYQPMPGKPSYPLLTLLRENGVCVTVNTDNIGISAASLTDNFMLLEKMTPGITRMEILQLIRNGLEQSFVLQQFRNQLIRDFNKRIFNHLLNHNFR